MKHETRTNEARVEEALQNYNEDRDAYVGLIDLLADAMHHFGEHRFNTILDVSRAHYEAELKGE
jgi:hypothetical protein